jgi:hypothetical protein
MIIIPATQEAETGRILFWSQAGEKARPHINKQAMSGGTFP